jgi:hypothetical protein
MLVDVCALFLYFWSSIQCSPLAVLTCCTKPCASGSRLTCKQLQPTSLPWHAFAQHGNARMPACSRVDRSHMPLQPVPGGKSVQLQKRWLYRFLAGRYKKHKTRRWQQAGATVQPELHKRSGIDVCVFRWLTHQTDAGCTWLAVLHKPLCMQYSEQPADSG